MIIKENNSTNVDLNKDLEFKALETENQKLKQIIEQQRKLIKKYEAQLSRNLDGDYSLTL